MSNGCVQSGNVCVCVKERERERERESSDQPVSLPHRFHTGGGLELSLADCWLDEPLLLKLSGGWHMESLAVGIPGLCESSDRSK